MAKQIVGYRSPFPSKASPMKLDPIVTSALIGAGASILGNLFGSRRRRREQRRANAQYERARADFMSINYKNPYAGLKNPYAGLKSPYEGLKNVYAGLENVYEDLTVDQKAAEFMRQQTAQQQANIMQGMKGAAGASGVAGLAQSIAGVGAQQAGQAAATISQQEAANERAAAAGASRLQEMKATGAGRLAELKATGRQQADLLKRRGAYDVEIAKRKGRQWKVGMEQQRLENLYGLSMSRKMAADEARQTATSNIWSSIGQVGAGIAGHYGPMGMGSGQFGTDLGFGFTGSGGGWHPTTPAWM